MAQKASKKKPKELAYTLTIHPVGTKKKAGKKSINIRGSMALRELDQEIRQKMGYDTWDHLSAFYNGKPHRSPEIATITPDGDGDNSTLTIDELQLSKGSEIGYVYDFGDDIQSILRVEEVMPYEIRF